ncbi:MAG: LCP family protein [Lachnospiraceae bacterium]|nr:LCP family protein [Lachnospiraceae bacterium]
MAGNTRSSKKAGHPTGVAAARARKNRKITIFFIEIVIILAMLGILWLVMDRTEDAQGLLYTDTTQMDPVELKISEVVTQQAEEGGSMAGYLNIALFGIDAMSDNSSDLLKGYRSDSIMIASINQDTYEVKLVSVYRDTYLNLSNDTYSKCNSAYAKGGAQQAVSMLNANMDMDITNWVSVSYKALITSIDDLGGIYIDVDSAELEHINNYQISIAKALKMGENNYTPVTTTGYQKLNGLQASAYCRIRYTAGDDFKRAERQREVLQAMMDAAKKADVNTLLKFALGDSKDDKDNGVLSYIYTSLDSDTIANLLTNISKYNIVAEGGFPEQNLRTTGTIGSNGSCVIPLNLTENVVWLHQFLFGDDSYTPSSTVTSYSDKIRSDTSKYLN